LFGVKRQYLLLRGVRFAAVPEHCFKQVSSTTVV
jgi:hypothetical protein